MSAGRLLVKVNTCGERLAVGKASAVFFAIELASGTDQMAVRSDSGVQRYTT
jgi:hypothetical protein